MTRSRPTVRKRDGIHVECDRTVVADARSATGDVTLVSHAHADHARSAAAPVVCSSLTADLLRTRRGVDLEARESAPGVSLLPSGHVHGSRAALIEGNDGTRYLYTGDVSTRDRGPLSGFEPVDADVLIVEATYGRPAYRFPPQDDLEARITDRIADASEPLVLLGYSLGRAQHLCRLARAATNRRLVVHPSVAAVNRTIEAATGLEFGATSLSSIGELRADDVVVAPAGSLRSGRIARHVERTGAVTLGFSGWAIDDAFRYRVGADEAFVLTDHCDFDELLALVEAVDPERVYTHHGFAEDLGDHLSGPLGYDAVALKRDQATLGDF